MAAIIARVGVGWVGEGQQDTVRIPIEEPAPALARCVEEYRGSNFEG